MIDLIKSVDGDVNRLNGELTADIKDRYRTAFDHDQFKLLECGAARQKWIDMGQSLNLFNSSTSLKYLNDLYFHANRLGLKSTYYLRNRSASEIEKSTEVKRDSSNNNNNNNQDPLDGDKTLPEACSILDPTCESCQ